MKTITEKKKEEISSIDYENKLIKGTDIDIDSDEFVFLQSNESEFILNIKNEIVILKYHNRFKHWYATGNQKLYSIRLNIGKEINISSLNKISQCFENI